jgi:hypothetical protein
LLFVVVVVVLNLLLLATFSHSLNFVFFSAQVEQGVAANLTRMRSKTIDHQTNVNRRLGITEQQQQQQPAN